MLNLEGVKGKLSRGWLDVFDGEDRLYIKFFIFIP